MSLRVNQLSGFGSGKGRIPLSMSYIGTTNSTVNGSSFNFSSVAIGVADSNRLVVVAISTDADSGPTVTSCTIGGISATLVGATSSTYVACVMAYANVPSGTTATIAINTAGVCSSCGIGVYALYGLNSFTPVGTNTSVALNPTLSATSQVGGMGVAVSTDYNGGGVPTHTWGSPMTEDYDYQIDDSITTAGSGAHKESITGTTLSFTLTRSAGSNYCAALATWR